MKNLDEVLEEWRKDSDIDRTEPGKALLDIPKLHSKYLNVLSQHRMLAKQAEFNYNKWKKIKWEYYTGKLDDDELQKYGWEPFPFVIKSDLSTYLESDEDLNKYMAKKAIHEEIVEVCLAIMKELNSRTYQLRSWIDWENLYKVFDLVLHKKNEAFIQFECERSIAQELSDYFTFFVPGYQFTPAYKSRIWDGRIRLADLRTFTIYHGLIPYIEKFCAERNYSLEIADAIKLTQEFSGVEALEFVKTLNLPHELREYQWKSFLQAVRNKRQLILSPTASGKSLIIYLIVRWLQEADFKTNV